MRGTADVRSAWNGLHKSCIARPLRAPDGGRPAPGPGPPRAAARSTFGKLALPPKGSPRARRYGAQGLSAL